MGFFNGGIVKLYFQFSKTKVKIGKVRKGVIKEIGKKGKDGKKGEEGTIISFLGERRPIKWPEKRWCF